MALSPSLDAAGRALLELGRALRAAGYRFTAISPESHRRVNARAGAARARSLHDVFGWSRPFAPGVIPDALVELLRRADALVEQGELLASKVRYATLGDGLYVHGAFPTLDDDAVYFGPDSYRYAALLSRVVAPARRVVDLGAGSGVGGLSLAGRVERIVLADINPAALALARVNVHLAGLTERVELVHGDLFAAVTGPVDLVISNPPYMHDPGHRAYRDGGGPLGTSLGVRIVEEGLARLAPGGQLVLYTGAPIVDGVDQVRVAIAPALDAGAARWTYEELDPDVYGDELSTPAYAEVDRIAVVAAVAHVPAR